MDPAFQCETGEQNEDKPAEGAVEGSPGERAEDCVGNEGFVKAGTGGRIRRGHLIEWYAGTPLLRHVVGEYELQSHVLALET